MELKEYQQQALAEVKRYLETLGEWCQNATKNPKLEIDFPSKAWEKAQVGRPYYSRKDGLNRQLPTFCLKIPTGGGKTLLAVKAIDLINGIYLRKRTGLVLWIVPTTQIYRQTFENLRNREHPYRQLLDIASGERTFVLEKKDHFTPMDVDESLVILMLMLPSASRQHKETLKVFQDGGFQQFFPQEDDVEGQNKLLEKIPNLDSFGDENSFWGRQVKTSLGNTLRLQNPIIILDEGHKAYSEMAQATLRGFNPSIIVELSATPSKESNILVDISGIELHREEMIKLDLHIINKLSLDWKNTLLDGVNHRGLLEKESQLYKANTGIYIRPINLIQVERTGKDQRDGKRVHADDVRETLIRTMGIPAEQVAIKTSEKDELKQADDLGGLMSRDCPIRYIITKHALQEGWDCSFAYVLTILTNPSSQTALTQLVGRILRQPFARKTKTKALDESYVFCYQRRALALVEDVKEGFGREGLGDLTGLVALSEEKVKPEKTCEIRSQFRDTANRIVLPFFVVQRENGEWHRVSYDMDIISRISWQEVNIEPMWTLPLTATDEKDTEYIATISEDRKQLVKQKPVRKIAGGDLRLDPVFMAHQLLDIVPNPWTAYELAVAVLSELLKRNGEIPVMDSLVFIIEELRNHLSKEKNRLAERIFRGLLQADKLRFLVIGEQLGFKFPEKIKVKDGARLHRKDYSPLQRSLFELLPNDEFNSIEKNVAWYLEGQERLLFWFRNIPKHDYSIQGWGKNKIYPDFIFTASQNEKKSKLECVFVLETKGLHLKNEDTAYKQNVFEICNSQAKKMQWAKAAPALDGLALRFEVAFEDEWQRKLNELLKLPATV